jgi:hypothetical protein
MGGRTAPALVIRMSSLAPFAAVDVWIGVVRSLPMTTSA